MILIIGTPDSGKSAIAESFARELAENKPAAYIATMIPFGEEGEKRIAKHRMQREGKNFITFEEPYKVCGLHNLILNRDIDTALLECVSNLVGNVIHMDENILKSEDALVEEIVNDVAGLSNALKNLVVVANNFSMDEGYDDDTKRYVRINNAVNEKLKGYSNKYLLKADGEWREYENN